MANESELSPAEKKVLRDIRTNGWAVITVASEEGAPGWAFSIGLFETYKQPEILLFGLRGPTMQQLINQVAEQMQEGTKYADGFRDDTLLEGYGCQFKTVAERWVPETVGFARWFYGETEFPVLQLYWPDKNGRFPWDRRCDAAVRALQPRLHVEDAAEAGAEWLL